MSGLSKRSPTAPPQRSAAGLGRRRRREFGGGLGMGDGEEPTFGWGSLEQDVFQWILESRIPEDCWAAVKLYAELNQGANPRWKPRRSARGPGGAVAGRRPGRGRLVGPSGACAAELLALPRTLWPPRAERQPDVEPLDEKEQTALIDGVTPLLKDPDFSDASRRGPSASGGQCPATGASRSSARSAPSPP